jgi:hypothetical protein
MLGNIGPPLLGPMDIPLPIAANCLASSCLRQGEPATFLGLGQDRSTPLPDKLTVLYIFRAGYPSLASGLRMQKVASRHASGLDTAGGAPRARTLRSAYLAPQ